MKDKRTRIWVDRFQTQLFVRITMYFVLYQAAVCATFYFGRGLFEAFGRLVNQEVPGYFFLIAAGIMICFASFFIYDAMKFAHRVVGPLYRIHKAINTIVTGERSEPLRLRRGDYLQDLKDDFNKMLIILEQRGAIELKKAETKKDKNQPDPVHEGVVASS